MSALPSPHQHTPALDVDRTVIGAARTLQRLADDRAYLFAHHEHVLHVVRGHVPRDDWRQVQISLEAMRVNEMTSQAIRQTLVELLGAAG